MKDGTIAIISTGSIIGVLLAVSIYFSYAACEAKGISFGGVDWGIVQGCMVYHNDRWLPLENIRGFK